MAVKKIFSRKIGEKGQAVFELIIFLPIFLYMTTILFDYGDAINNSINQLKAVRGYYYYSISNDTSTPNLQFSGDFQANNARFIGLDSFAWSFIPVVNGSSPQASCVKVTSFLSSGDSSATCEEPATNIVADQKTQFIRMYSAFGVCTGGWLQTANNNTTAYSLSWPDAANHGCAVEN